MSFSWQSLKEAIRGINWTWISWGNTALIFKQIQLQTPQRCIIWTNRGYVFFGIWSWLFSMVHVEDYIFFFLDPFPASTTLTFSLYNTILNIIEQPSSLSVLLEWGRHFTYNRWVTNTITNYLFSSNRICKEKLKYVYFFIFLFSKYTHTSYISNLNVYLGNEVTVFLVKNEILMAHQ